MSSSSPRDTVASDVVWLTDDQQRAWRQLVPLLVMLPAALERDLQRATGLTIFEYMVLTNLSEADQLTLPMSELARRANSSLSRLSHVVSRLVDNGWVHKRSCPTDRRVSEVTLTKPGHAVLVKAAPHHVASVRERVIEPLSPAQLADLGRAAELIAERLDQSGPDTNPA